MCKKKDLQAANSRVKMFKFEGSNKLIKMSVCPTGAAREEVIEACFSKHI